VGVAAPGGEQVRYILLFTINKQFTAQVFPWVATVDGEFLTDTPYNLISQGRYQHKDALLGVNADEGTFWILFALAGFTKDGPSLQNLTMFRNGVDVICWDLNEQQVLSSFFRCCRTF